MNWNTTDIKEISKSGRIRLFGNAWFDIVPDCAFQGMNPKLKSGKRYQFLIDTDLRTIHGIKSVKAATNTDQLMSLLYSEIDRLRALNSVQRDYIHTDLNTDEFEVYLAEQAGKGRINTRSYDHEIHELEHHLTVKQVDREMQTGLKVPGILRIMQGHYQKDRKHKDTMIKLATEHLPADFSNQDIEDWLESNGLCQ